MALLDGLPELQTTMRSVGSTSVHVYTEDHPALARTLRNKLRKRRQELLEELYLSGDWPDFKKRIGRIAGFDEAVDLCVRAEKELHGD